LKTLTWLLKMDDSLRSVRKAGAIRWVRRTYSFGNSPRAKEDKSDVFPQAPASLNEDDNEKVNTRSSNEKERLTIAHNNEFSPQLVMLHQRDGITGDTAYPIHGSGYDTYRVLWAHDTSEKIK
jgi:hypothetical protein